MYYNFLEYKFVITSCAVHLSDKCTFYTLSIHLKVLYVLFVHFSFITMFVDTFFSLSLLYVLCLGMFDTMETWCKLWL